MNDVPQPHVPFAWGFLNAKPAPIIDSCQSISVPLTNRRALRIEEDLDALRLEDLVGGRGGLVEVELVGEPGAAAAHDLDAQPRPLGRGLCSDIRDLTFVAAFSVSVIDMGCLGYGNGRTRAILPERGGRTPPRAPAAPTLPPMADLVYLDHLATTPIDPRVLRLMGPWLEGRYGHPASRSHAFGWEAEEAVETARARVADLVHADPKEIVFTSGGTEADNLAVQGVAEAYEARGRHVVTTAVEKRPVLDTCRWLEEMRAFAVTRVAPHGDGRVSAETIAAALRADTILVWVQAANAEVGAIQPTAEIGALCAGRRSSSTSTRWRRRRGSSSIRGATASI